MLDILCCHAVAFKVLPDRQESTTCWTRIQQQVSWRLTLALCRRPVSDKQHRRQHEKRAAGRAERAAAKAKAFPSRSREAMSVNDNGGEATSVGAGLAAPARVELALWAFTGEPPRGAPTRPQRWPIVQRQRKSSDAKRHRQGRKVEDGAWVVVSRLAKKSRVS